MLTGLLKLNRIWSGWGTEDSHRLESQNCMELGDIVTQTKGVEAHCSSLHLLVIPFINKYLFELTTCSPCGEADRHIRIINGALKT